MYLASDYLPEHNRRFARASAKPEDYHLRAPRAAELDGISRLESERTISNDWVVRYDNRLLQLEGQGRYYAPAQSKVLVCEGRHGSIAIEYRGRALRWQEVPVALSLCLRRMRWWSGPPNRARNGGTRRQRITRGERQFAE